jgi:hypothetical protein
VTRSSISLPHGRCLQTADVQWRDRYRWGTVGSITPPNPTKSGKRGARLTRARGIRNALTAVLFVVLAVAAPVPTWARIVFGLAALLEVGFASSNFYILSRIRRTSDAS